MTSLGAIAPPGVASVATASDLTTACNAIFAVLADYNKQLRELSNCGTKEVEQERIRLEQSRGKVAVIHSTYCL